MNSIFVLTVLKSTAEPLTLYMVLKLINNKKGEKHKTFQLTPLIKILNKLHLLKLQNIAGVGK